jgi:hypothetical protein
MQRGVGIRIPCVSHTAGGDHATTSRPSTRTLHWDSVAPTTSVMTPAMFESLQANTTKTKIEKGVVDGVDGGSVCGTARVCRGRLGTHMSNPCPPCSASTKVLTTVLNAVRTPRVRWAQCSLRRVHGRVRSTSRPGTSRESVMGCGRGPILDEYCYGGMRGGQCGHEAAEWTVSGSAGPWPAVYGFLF